MNSNVHQHRVILQRIAHRVMIERGLLPDFEPAVLTELSKLKEPAIKPSAQVRDLTGLLWASIDNDDSRDLDQLTVAEALPDGTTRVLVAVADVDSLVALDSEIDRHARHNTTSVYTAAEIFPMLPENLSTNLTSLNLNEDRRAIVVELVVDASGLVQKSDLYPAWVRNHAKLAYNSVAAWLDNSAPMPEAVAAVNGLDQNLKLQDAVAAKMKELRHQHGALTFETIQPKAEFEGDQIKGINAEFSNRAKAIIEDFMIAANGVTARFLETKKFPSIRRVVRTPKRWDRIVQIAGEHRVNLPAEPDSKALEDFLAKARIADPVRFPDLSLSVIKLLGAGEYVAELPGETAPGHFGLAVKDYAHSTAPNRRYPDIITQRLLKAAINGVQVPYSDEELRQLAQHCTEQEDAANKVERQVNKSAAAMFLESRIGERFDAIVTGSGPKGTWVRLINPPIEGKLETVSDGPDVGQRVHVQLMRTDVERGFIDFRAV
ncbi:MAG: RNB domain-containing ribonuclease [Candidatus Zixiibacteriota bacterium]